MKLFLLKASSCPHCTPLLGPLKALISVSMDEIIHPQNNQSLNPFNAELIRNDIITK